MNGIYTELSAYMKLMNARERLLLYRGEEELLFLKEWISHKDNLNKQETPAVHIAPDNSLPGIVKSCIKCGNVYNKKFGLGTCENGVMIILNTPAAVSRIERERFKDQSKELLKKMIGAINLDLKDCYTTNLIKCDAGDSLNRPALLLKNCEPILQREIQELDPDIIIVMGDDMPIKRMINENSDRSWYKIEHPLSLIKNPALKKSAWTTLQKVDNFLNRK